MESDVSGQKADNNVEKGGLIYDPLEVFKNLNESRKKPKDNKNVVKKIVFNPILYDPIKQSRNKLIKNTAPLNCIIRPWKGCLEYNNTSFNLGMYAYNTNNNNITLFQTLPNLPEKIVFTSRAKTKEVIPYIEKHYYSKHKQTVYGWFEPEDDSNLVILYKINTNTY